MAIANNIPNEDRVEEYNPVVPTERFPFRYALYSGNAAEAAADLYVEIDEVPTTDFTVEGTFDRSASPSVCLDAEVVFAPPGVTGKVIIKGRWQPRRIDQFPEAQRVPPRNLNAIMNAIVAAMREAEGRTRSGELSRFVAEAEEFRDEAEEFRDTAEQFASEASVGLFRSGTFTGDGIADEFDLFHEIARPDRLLWWENGVRQSPGSDYTVSGSVVTRASPPENGAAIAWLLLGDMPGADGTQLYENAGDPDPELGVDGDVYLQRTDGTAGAIGDLWRKISGTWQQTGGNYRGPGGEGNVNALASFATDNRLLRSDGTGMDVQASGVSLDDLDRISGAAGLYIGMSPDAGHQVAAKINSALWDALPEGEGGTGDFRKSMNKESAAHTVSLLLQSALEGRAEIGLVEDDDLVVKVSPDGETWIEAVRIDKDTGAAAFPNTLAPIEALGFALSDETTALSTGTAKLTVRMPYAFALSAVRASVNTASSSGVVTVDINEGGTSILSTKLSIDASEKTSVTAATPAVISDASLADDAEITFDIDASGTGAKGLKVWLIGRKA